MEIKTGISVPNVYEKSKLHQRSSFLDNAVDNFKIKRELDAESKKLNQINQEMDTKIDKERRGDFLERAEHIMKVDQFIAKDFKLDEENQKHESVVNAYRDSLIEWTINYI